MSRKSDFSFKFFLSGSLFFVLIRAEIRTFSQFGPYKPATGRVAFGELKILKPFTILTLDFFLVNFEVSKECDINFAFSSGSMKQKRLVVKKGCK